MFAKTLDNLFNVIFPLALIILTLGLYISMWMRN